MGLLPELVKRKAVLLARMPRCKRESQKTRECLPEESLLSTCKFEHTLARTCLALAAVQGKLNEQAEALM